MAFDAPSLKGRALRLLGRREYSRFELERKLTPYEEEPGTLAAALDELQAKGFISEQRVLESVVNRRSGKLGVTRIKQELLGKGLAPQAVAAAVADLRGTELERAQTVWQKKFGVSAVDAQSLGKQMRFLAARGFGGDVIRRVLTLACDELPINPQE